MKFAIHSTTGETIAQREHFEEALYELRTLVNAARIVRLSDGMECAFLCDRRRPARGPLS